MKHRRGDDHDDHKTRSCGQIPPKKPSPQLHYHRADEYDDDEDDIDEEEEERQIQAARAAYGARRRLEREQEEDIDDEDDIDEEEEEDPEITLQRLLYDQEHCRHSIANLFRTCPELQRRWQQFQRIGGVTAQDFERFLNGQLRPRIVRRQRHLQLVHSRKTIPLKLIKTKPGNDAA